jgi:hypothetical protein
MNNAIMYDYYSYGNSSSDDEKDLNLEDPDSKENKLKNLMKARGLDPNESDSEAEQH